MLTELEARQFLAAHIPPFYMTSNEHDDAGEPRHDDGHLERLAEDQERRMDDEREGKIGSNIDRLLEKYPMAEFREE